jgi:hypothetical protein
MASEYSLSKIGFIARSGSRKKILAPYAGEGPSESLEHGLSLHVVAKPFKREIAIPVALDGQTLTITFHDQIDAARTDHPPWNDVVASLDQTLYDIALECGLDPSSFVAEAPGKELGGFGRAQ